MKEAYRLAKEQFHEVFAGLFFIWIFFNPISAFLHFLIAYMSKGIYHFWDLLAIPSAYSAYLILKGKRTGVYLFLLCAILNLLTQVSLVSSSIIIQQIIDIPIFAIIMYVLFFRLKKNGKTAWSVLK